MKLLNELILFAFLGVLISLSQSGYAKEGNITCFTPQSRQGFKLQKNSSGFTVKILTSESNRLIASVRPERTKYHSNGLTKYIKFEGKNYTLHIENWNKFSEVDDYVAIRSAQGHEITYPLNCEIN